MFGQENMVVFVNSQLLLTNSGSKIEAGQIGQVCQDFWPPTVQSHIKIDAPQEFFGIFKAKKNYLLSFYLLTVLLTWF